MLNKFFGGQLLPIKSFISLKNATTGSLGDSGKTLLPRWCLNDCMSILPIEQASGGNLLPPIQLAVEASELLPPIQLAFKQIWELNKKWRPNKKGSYSKNRRALNKISKLSFLGSLPGLHPTLVRLPPFFPWDDEKSFTGVALTIEEEPQIKSRGCDLKDFVGVALTIVSTNEAVILL